MIYEILPVNNYRGNSNSTNFDFDFYIEDESQLKVYLFDENNLKIELLYNVDYSINEFKNKQGSYITFPLVSSKYSILKETEQISLELNLPISQETQYNNSSLLNLEALEYSLDYLTRLIQIISRKVSRCVKVEECSETTPDELIDEIYTKTQDIKEQLADSKEALQNIEKISNDAKNLAQEILDLNPAYNDFSNITNEAKEIIKQESKLRETTESLATKTNETQAAKASLPSSNQISLTVLANNSRYTAPADGYMCAHNDNVVCISFWNETRKFGITAGATAGVAPRIFMPVNKNDAILTHYPNANQSTQHLYFIYANGTQEE